MAAAAATAVLLAAAALPLFILLTAALLPVLSLKETAEIFEQIFITRGVVPLDYQVLLVEDHEDGSGAPTR